LCAASSKSAPLRETSTPPMSCWPPGFVLHVPLPCSPGVRGIDEVVSACRAAFQGLDVTVEDMVTEGDMVAARFTARGVHNGAFMGLPPTGKPITMTGIEIFRLENGKIAELWGEANLLGLMQQLGILPPMEQ